MDELLVSLKKKDPDLVVVEHSDNHLVVESDAINDVPDGTERVESVIDPPLPNLFKDENNTPATHISVKVIRAIFITNAGFAFMGMLVGLVPYFVLRYDVSVVGLSIGMGIVGVGMAVAYVSMYMVQDQFYTVPLIGIWMFLLIVFLDIWGALKSSLAPFQAVTIVACQSVSILIYCFLSHRKINVVWALGIMCGAGLVPWLCGIYAFIRDNDWVTAFVLFLFCVIGFALYAANQIRLVGRFSVSREDLVRAVVHYYTDALFGPIRWMKIQWKTYQQGRRARQQQQKEEQEMMIIGPKGYPENL